MTQTSGTGQPTQLPTTLGWFREGVNWLVVLSSGVLVIAAGFYKDFVSAPDVIKWVLIVSLSGFLASILCGVLCYFWINAYANQREARDAFGEQVSKLSNSQDPMAKDAAAKQDKAEREMQTALRRYRGWYYAVMWSFSIAMLFLAVFLISGLLVPIQSSKGSAENKGTSIILGERYMIAHSAEHRGADGRRHVHTFLVDRTEGGVWQMYCRTNGEVEFKRTLVEGLPAGRQ